MPYASSNHRLWLPRVLTRKEVELLTSQLPGCSGLRQRTVHPALIYVVLGFYNIIKNYVKHIYFSYRSLFSKPLIENLVKILNFLFRGAETSVSVP